MRKLSFSIAVLFLMLSFCSSDYSQNVQRLKGKGSFPYNINSLIDINKNNNVRSEDIKSDFISLPDQHNRLKYIPGELIINYKIKSINDDVKGTKILDEYNIVKNAVTETIGTPVKNCKPVFSFIVNKMVEKNLNERDAKAELFSSVNQKQNKFRNNSLAIDQRNLALINQTEFSRTIVIRVEDPNIDPEFLKNQLLSNPKLTSLGYDINYIEPNYLYYCNYTTNDPYVSQQWALTQTQADLGWDIERGNSNILIGILDTGIDLLHEDLSPNILLSASYDFVDIDTNLYKTSGYTTILGEDYTTLDDNPQDFNGHGTHCAGIAGAKGNNGIGISGVSHNCSLVALRAGFSIKVGSTEYGVLEDDDIANGIMFAITKGVDVLSMSFESDSPSQTIKNAIDLAHSNGIVLVAAAGNSSYYTKSYPAAFDGVISVAATDSYDKRASFSNYGRWVDVAAPGESIISTVPKSGGANTNYSGYNYLSGTSMAAPFVAGVAGLLLSKNPSLIPDQVEYIIKRSVDIPQEQASYIGTGRINANKALSATTIKDLNLKADITSLTEGTLYTTNLNIIGSASGDNYTLDYGVGPYPSNWTLISSGLTVSNGVLGNLDISNIPDDNYTIRLITSNSTSETEYRVGIKIGSFSDNHFGWPVKINNYYNNSLSSHFAISDINNDGKKEILITSAADKSNSHNYNDAQCIYIYNSEGQLLNGRPIPLHENGFTNCTPSAADFDGDGNKEIVIVGTIFDFKSQNFGKSFIQIIKSNGSNLPGWPKIISAMDANSKFAIGDVNLDGKLDLILATGSGSCSTCDNNGKIHVFNSDGTYQNGWPQELNQGYIGRSNIVLANLDSDPEMEIIVTSFNNKDPNGAANYTCAYNHNGSVVPGFPYKQGKWGWSLAAADLNRDGMTEILTQGGLLSNKGQKLPWIHSDINIYSSIAICNIDDDPKLETLYGDGNGKLYLTDCNGLLKSGWPIREEQFTADGHHIIADISGDEKPEIIACWVSNTTSTVGLKPGLFAYNIDGTIVPGFPKYKNIMSFTQVAVDDIDNDNKLELIGLDGSDNRIIVLDLDKNYQPAKIEWPTYLQNSWLSSAVPDVKSCTFTKFNDFTINEDDSLALSISPFYFDWKNITINYKADNSSVGTIFQDGILKILPGKNWFGDADISLSTYNSYFSDSVKYHVTVKPKNDLPILALKFPDININEDELGSIIIPNLNTFFSDPDLNDHLSITAFPIDKGLDSLIIGKFSQNNFKSYLKSRSLSVKRGSVPAQIKSANNDLYKKFGLGTFNKLNINRNLTSNSDSLCLIAFPQKDFNGNVRIVIKATDDSLASLSDTLLLNIKPVNDPPKIEDIVDQVINEDDTLKMVLSVNDFDKDTLTYKGYSNVNSIKFIYNKNVCKIVPDKNWNGNALIYLTVSDGKICDTTNFKLTVNPVNDPPSSFSLLEPKNNNEVFLLDHPENDTMLFKWNKASDVENDTVLYKFTLSDSVHYYDYCGLKDTLIYIPFSRLYDIINHQKNSSKKIFWFVKALDKMDSTLDLNSSYNLILHSYATDVKENYIPKEFALYQNFPNPFNPATTIRYDIPTGSNVSIKIFDILGNEVITLVDSYKSPGVYELRFDANKLASGIYFCQIQAENFIKIRKMALLK